MVRETEVRSQVESYQRLKKWYLMPPRLTLNITRYGSRVVEQTRKKVTPSSTPRCSSYWKGSLRVTLDYGLQLYLLYFYIYIYMSGRRRVNCYPHQVCLVRKMARHREEWKTRPVKGQRKLLTQRPSSTITRGGRNSWVGIQARSKTSWGILFLQSCQTCSYTVSLWLWLPKSEASPVHPVGVVCNLVISVDVHPNFTGIAL